VRRTLLAIAATSVVALAAGSSPALAATHTWSHDYPVSLSPYEVQQAQNIVPTPRVDGFITRMRISVVDPDGTPVPIKRLMLHHIVFASLGKPNPACSSFTGFDSRTYPYYASALPFMGRGEEDNRLALPDGYGYRIAAKDNYWGMVWMLMNHRGVTDNALIRYTVTYEDASANLTPVTPYWLDVRNCHADPVYDVPGGGGKDSVFKQTYDYTMPESGRIVAIGGHVHGGAKDLVVSEPDCNNRTVFKSKPAWGMPDHPFYKVRPKLHSPGPISMSQFRSQQGFPISKGDRIRLTSNYYNEIPSTRVMGIAPFYLAPQTVPHCGAKPNDIKTTQPAQIAGTPFRTKAPRFIVPLTSLKNGKAVEVDRPSGKTVSLQTGATISAFNYDFSKHNVAIDSGSTLNWSFGSTTLHNVTLANGPRGFSSPNLSDSRTYKFKFTKPGTYKLFCALHPVQMLETVKVRKP
jgi:plastocyanin